MSVSRDQVVLNLERGVLWRLPGTYTRRDGLDNRVQRTVVEEGNRVPVFLGDGRLDTVHRAEVPVIGPPLHQIADVDDIGTLDGLHIVPGACRLVEDLETADVVLEEKSEGAKVRVSADAAASDRVAIGRGGVVMRAAELNTCLQTSSQLCIAGSDSELPKQGRGVDLPLGSAAKASNQCSSRSRLRAIIRNVLELNSCMASKYSI